MKVSISVRCVLVIMATHLFFALPSAAVGPPSSDKYKAETGDLKTSVIKTNTKLNIIIPVLDPNFPKDPDDFEKKGIWPELRRTEANLFAMRIKDAIQSTGAFGSIRVSPNDYVSGDLYVSGKILKSTSEEIELKILVQDSTLKYWSGKSGKKFKYRVREYDLENVRKKNDDPFKPLYGQIGKYLVSLLAKKKEANLMAIRDTSKMVFARSFSVDEFSSYFRKSRSSNKLKGLPHANDPKYVHVGELQVKDALFMDKMQHHYQKYAQKLNASYALWQRQSFPEAKAYRLAKIKARKDVLKATALAVVSAGLANSTKNNGSNTDSVKEGAAAAAGAAALVLGYKAFKTSKSSKQYVAALNELGKSVDMELAPQVIELENETVKLKGDASEQFQQWREYLVKSYASQQTPEVRL